MHVGRDGRLSQDLKQRMVQRMSVDSITMPNLNLIIKLYMVYYDGGVLSIPHSKTHNKGGAKCRGIPLKGIPVYTRNDRLKSQTAKDSPTKFKISVLASSITRLVKIRLDWHQDRRVHYFTFCRRRNFANNASLFAFRFFATKELVWSTN
jgi:hypothetical protein